MNCPICNELLSLVPNAGSGLGVEAYQCPKCLLKGITSSPVMMGLEANPTQEYRRHCTPDQLRELVESCPADVPTLQAVLSVVWQHYCWAVRLLVMGEASTASLVALAIARSDAAAALRDAMKQGGAK